MLNVYHFHTEPKTLVQGQENIETSELYTKLLYTLKWQVGNLKNRPTEGLSQVLTFNGHVNSDNTALVTVTMKVNDTAPVTAKLNITQKSYAVADSRVFRFVNTTVIKDDDIVYDETDQAPMVGTLDFVDRVVRQLLAVMCEEGTVLSMINQQLAYNAARIDANKRSTTKSPQSLIYKTNIDEKLSVIEVSLTLTFREQYPITTDIKITKAKGKFNIPGAKVSITSSNGNSHIVKLDAANAANLIDQAISAARY